MDKELMEKLFDISERCAVAELDADDLAVVRKAYWELQNNQKVLEDIKAEINNAYQDIQAEIRRFMYDLNPSSSESDYACNYVLDIIQQKIDKLKEVEE